MPAAPHLSHQCGDGDRHGLCGGLRRVDWQRGAPRGRVVQAARDRPRHRRYSAWRKWRNSPANVLELATRGGKVDCPVDDALDSLDPAQRRALESCATLIPAAIPTIERIGGGGVRCMLAEMHLPKRA